jgi:hypothetical protein
LRLLYRNLAEIPITIKLINLFINQLTTVYLQRLAVFFTFFALYIIKKTFFHIGLCNQSVTKNSNISVKIL